LRPTWLNAAILKKKKPFGTKLTLAGFVNGQQQAGLERDVSTATVALRTLRVKMRAWALQMTWIISKQLSVIAKV
jgi:hypothetical protein